MSFQNKVVWITGASSGIGKALAIELDKQGALLILSARKEKKLNEVKDACVNSENIKVLPLDLEYYDQFEKKVEEALKWFGRIDILVNNAAIRLRKPLSEIAPKAFSEVVEANLNSVYAISMSFASRLDKKDIKGSLINITSIAGPRARPGDPAYTAAKGGLEPLTRSLAVELAPHIRCNAIAPGYFATDANAAHIDNQEVKQFVENRIPLKRWGQPEEIVGAAVFLASDASSYITGHTLVIDAGLTVLF